MIRPSVFFFAAHLRELTGAKYEMLFEASRFADEHGFEAVWIPERHFNDFGGLYSNPSVISAALAVQTHQVALRAGSVILPLHNTIRVAEEWAIVDQLSRGRVGISFGSGWHVNDFALAPEHYGKRKERMLSQIDDLKKLWHGARCPATNGAGRSIEIATSPPPYQSTLPVWLTAESRETFLIAGRRGENVLTALTHQSLEDLAQNIAAYRDSLLAAGHDPQAHQVTLMQHTFVADSDRTIAEVGGRAYEQYLRCNMALQESHIAGLSGGAQGSEIDSDDVRDLAERGFARLRKETGLIGTPEEAKEKLRRLETIGVQEVACLVDFVPSTREVMRSLGLVSQLFHRP